MSGTASSTKLAQEYYLVALPSNTIAAGMSNQSRVPIILAVMLATVAGAALAADPTPLPVKRSNSDICHDADSLYYALTGSKRTYATMDDCVRDGGTDYRQVTASRPSPNFTRPAPTTPEPDTVFRDINWPQLIGIVATVLFVAGLLWRPARKWFLKRHSRRRLRDAELDARKRWEGHRRE
jgi:hypothetical protein